MMRVQVFRNLSKPFPPLTEGWEGEVEDSVGHAIVDAKLGRDVTPPKPEPIKTVPKAAEFTTAPPADPKPILSTEADSTKRRKERQPDSVETK